jgi:alpha-L-rhamnosidase
VRPSGSRVLDAKAVAIVHAAAPFGPFSTAMRTQADQIVVTSLTTGAQVWDSGKVASSATAQVAYGGGALAADSRFSWTVSWWDGSGAAAPASAAATFGTAPGDDAAWDAAGAQWIGCTGVGANSNQLRVDFSAQPATAGLTVTQARLYATGLGWFLPFMNGRRLSEAALDPAFTSLRVRALYNAYDVTDLLDTSAAGNTFAAYLGHGWPEIFAPWGGSASGEAPGTRRAQGVRAQTGCLARKACARAERTKARSASLGVPSAATIRRSWSR